MIHNPIDRRHKLHSPKYFQFLRVEPLPFVVVFQTCKAQVSLWTLGTMGSADTRSKSPSSSPLKTSSAENLASKHVTDKKTDAEVKLSKNVPWYRAGGLFVSLNGMGINIFGAIIFLASHLSYEQRKQFWALVVFCILSACITRRTIYCILIVPCTMASTALVAQFHNWPLLLAISVALAIWKVNIFSLHC